MKRLKYIVLVQFYLFEKVRIPIDEFTAFTGANGAGKTTVLDALQLVLQGGNTVNVKFNARTNVGGKSRRTLGDYCLGAHTVESKGVSFRRRSAQSYLTLVFDESDGSAPLSVGLAITASENGDCEVVGRYVLRGVALTEDDHVLKSASGGEEPMTIKAFSAAMHSRMAGGAAPALFLHNHEQFLKEFFVGLNPNGSVHLRAYQQAFKNSQIRDVHEVDSFVRENVVSTATIDRKQAKVLIESLNRIKQLIDEVQKQIVMLETCKSAYGFFGTLLVNRSSLQLMIATEAYDRLNSQYQDLTEALEAGDQRKEESALLLRSSEAALALAQQQLTDAKIAQSADPESLRRGAALQALDSRREALVRSTGVVTGHLGGWLDGIEQARKTVALESLDDEAVWITRELAATRELLKAAPSSVAERLVPIREKALQYSDRLHQHSRNLQNKTDRISEQIQSIQETGKVNAGSPGRMISAEARRFREQLRSSGIEATPVCFGVRVKDREWRRAIETALGPNREAMIVNEDQEEAAIRVMRHLGRQGVGGLRVVLREQIAQGLVTPPPGSVGALLEGDDPVALAFARERFHQWAAVETDAELRRHTKALAKDGASTGGGTAGTKRQLATHLWLLGEIDADQQAEVSEAISGLQGDLNRIDRELKALRPALSKLPAPLTLDESFNQALAHLASVVSDFYGVAAKEAEIALVKDFGPTEADRLVEERTRLHAAAKSVLECHDNAAKEDSNLCLRLKTQIAALEPQRKTLHQIMMERKNDPLSNDTRAAELREELVERGGEDALMFQASERAKYYDQAIPGAQNRATGELNKLINSDPERFDYTESDLDVPKAQAFIERTHKFLSGTQLQEHQHDATKVKADMVRVFQQDVVHRIREGIHDMKATLNRLNNILAQSKEFSNGERYKFVWKERADHAEIVKYIENPTLSLDLAGDADSDLPPELERMIEEEDIGGRSVLDDFRQLYSFDLAILLGGKESGRLSERMGKGSNGEHLAPLYTIIAASLASAYRLSDRGREAGLSLILFDEAFGGMDERNSLMVGNFLRELGLQVVVAAPDTDQAKLTPICNRMYEIHRINSKVKLEHLEIKDKARALASSDYPERGRAHFPEAADA